MIRKLRQMGIPTSEAIQYHKEENAFAEKALLKVMEELDDRQKVDIHQYMISN